MDFVHLHLHSEYSLLDGAFRIRDIPKAAKEAGHTAVAITDHGAMYGAVAFFQACKAEGVKPIIGCEVYVASGSRFDRREAPDGGKYHLVLLCENEVGYRNLIYMVSRSYTEGFYGKPRIDMELLREHSEGLIALSACLAGYIPRMITAGSFDLAEEKARELDSLFGRGNFYLEMQDHGIEHQKEVNEALVALSEKTGIPLVVTNDCHYRRRADADTQAVLLCIQTNSRIDEGRPIGFETDEFYYKSTEEMRRLFPKHPEALANTVKIAERCNLEFDFSHTYLPRFVPETGETPEEYLKNMAYRGFEVKKANGEIRFTAENTEKVYLDRIAYELSVINGMGYAQYYLIVQDFIAFAKRSQIPVGPGRGSGAGSLVAYLVGITDVDSLYYHLMFERFLNPERVSMPDFDTDFCYDRRPEVIAYVSEKYGADHVCGISTFGTLAAKAVVRDVGRALGMSYADVDIVAKLIPNDLHITLEQSLQGKLKEMYDENADIHRLIDISMALEGMPRHASAHAAGIVITDKPAYEHVPLSVNNDMVLTQYPMDTVASLGLLKFDFLGLRYLTIISDTEKQIRRTDPSFDINKIPLDDLSTYELISQGKTDGVFQLESAGMRRLLFGMQPRSLEDITIAISLYRPGPMESIPNYLASRNGQRKTSSSIPAMDKILAETSGVIIYQEQVMQICREVAGFSFGKADIVRRAMAKKKAAEMEKARDSFLYGEKDEDGKTVCPGAVALGMPEEAASEVFDTMASFAKYAFNKSHATAYAFLSYRTAYLKCHYPSEYLASLLTSVLGNVTKTVEYIEEAKKNRIPVLSPDINESDTYYSVVRHDGKKAIRYGLLGIKNVGVSMLKATVDERKNGKFTSFLDFVSRMSRQELNKRQVEGLIKSGAFDSLSIPRSMLISEYERILDLYAKRKNNRIEGQLDLFSLNSAVTEEIGTLEEYTYTDRPEMPLKEKLRQEKESTGMYFSGHPLDEFDSHIKALEVKTKISDILLSFKEDAEAEPEVRYRDGQTVAVAGIITARVNKTTKANAQMAFLSLEDKSAEMELLVFPKVLEGVSYMLMPDVAIAAAGRLSVREEEPPKLLVSEIALLQPNFSGYATPLIDENAKPSFPASAYQKKERTNAASSANPYSAGASSVNPGYSTGASSVNPGYSTGASSVNPGYSTGASPAHTGSALYESGVIPTEPTKLYLKIPSVNSPVMKQISALLSIFCGTGVSVTLYDSEQKKSIKSDKELVPAPHLLAYLKMLLGPDNVVLK